MAKSNAQLNKKLREDFLVELTKWLEEKGEQVLTIKSNEICFPCVDEADNEKFIKIAVSVPQGERGGELFDGYSVADDYKFNCEEKAKKAEERAKEKAKKIERDKLQREKNAELKAKREQGA